MKALRYCLSIAMLFYCVESFKQHSLRIDKVVHWILDVRSSTILEYFGFCLCVIDNINVYFLGNEFKMQKDHSGAAYYSFPRE